MIHESLMTNLKWQRWGHWQLQLKLATSIDYVIVDDVELHDKNGDLISCICLSGLGDIWSRASNAIRVSDVSSENRFHSSRTLPKTPSYDIPPLARGSTVAGDRYIEQAWCRQYYHHGLQRCQTLSVSCCTYKANDLRSGYHYDHPGKSSTGKNLKGRGQGSLRKGLFACSHDHAHVHIWTAISTTWLVYVLLGCSWSQC